MSVRIGHASIDENGHAQGGKAGDQSGKEVCIRTWYDKPWSLLLRHPDRSVADRAAAACEAGCANPLIGYDQYQRNTAHTQAKAVGYDLAKISTACETDCSAFVTLCYIAAGVKALEYTGNAPTTATMQAAFTAAGFQVFTGSRYLAGTDQLRRGDVLVKPGSHTVMVLDDGAQVKQAAQVQKDEAKGVTEEQVKQMIERYGAAAVRAAIAEMGKAPESDWAREAMTWAMACGITDGSKPGAWCTREQVCTMLYRLYNLLK
ncbi:MAG: hypothetical protein MJ074_07650 [Oscillospiraceae bacterium]|nr:hypothetical protein [Oscillospiraceae bacterium]